MVAPKDGLIVEGNVGIGTTNPGKTLDVNGDINFTGTLYKNGTEFASSGDGTVNINNSNTAVSQIDFDSNDFTVSVDAEVATVALKSSIDTLHISGDASFNGDVSMNSNLQVNGIVTQF